MVRTLSNKSVMDSKSTAIHKKVISFISLLLVISASPYVLAAPLSSSESEVKQTSLTKVPRLQSLNVTERSLAHKTEAQQNVGNQLFKNRQTLSQLTKSNSIVRDYNPLDRTNIDYIRAFVYLLLDDAFSNSEDPIHEYEVIRDGTLTIELPAKDNCFLEAEPVDDNSVMLPTVLGVVVASESEGGFVRYLTVVAGTGYAEADDAISRLFVGEDSDQVDVIYQDIKDLIKLQTSNRREERENLVLAEKDESLAYLIWNVEAVFTNHSCPNLSR